MRSLGVIGLGLIGGSFARAAKAAGAHVVGVDCCAATRQMALACGAVDTVSAEPAAACEADNIFLAVPVGAYGEIFAALRKSLPVAGVVFDGGSCKRQTIQTAVRELADKAGRFVPSHPIAGGEDSGFAASSADLFNNRWVVLCPAGSDDDAVAAVYAAWKMTGAKTTEMTAEAHDATFAAVSHLPHVLSFALVESIRAAETHTQMLQYAAGGFRDFTRIAGSNSLMWRDICLQNPDQLLLVLGQFRRQLDELEAAISRGDGDTLQQKFAAARQLRRAWIDTLED